MTDVTDEQIAAWEADDDYDYWVIQRIDQLEQLCCDLHRGLVYALICAEVPLEGNGAYQDMKQRMEQLELLRMDGLCDLGQDHLHNSTAGLLDGEQ